MEMVKAMYTCEKCKLEKIEVDVRERSDTEDIINYTHYSMRKCSEDHALRSPYCHPKTLDLYLPMSQNGIGVAGPKLTDEQSDIINKQLKEDEDEQKQKRKASE